MTAKFPRRQFLKSCVLGSAALGLSAAGWSRRAAAQACAADSWGALVGNVGGASGWNCNNHPGYKILEIFLSGGSSQWETWWLPGNGAIPNLNDYGMGALPLAQLDWSANTAQFPCEAPDIPVSSSDAQLFAAQTGGGNIYWGAPAKPLYRRSDIVSRSRMVTQYHGLAPHEAAVPFVLSGLTLGNPRRAGAGAAIARRARVNDPAQLLPASYVLHRSSSYAANAAASTGVHPGFSRPVVIRVQNNNSFVNSLSRSGIAPEADNLLLALRHEHRDRLRFRGAGDPVRSSGFDGYWVAAELLQQAPAMQALFPGNMLQIDNNIDVCPNLPGFVPGNQPAAKTMLHAAASLLSTGPARYVCVIDSGINGTYDTHGSATLSHLLYTSGNFYNILHHLADVIHHPTNNPTGSLNLDDTLIVINTEFGRTPNVNGQVGRDHWTVGYVSTLIGGPISGGASIRGAMDASGYALTDHRYSATDMRGAVLLAAGIDPFAEGNYRFSDFSDAIRAGIGTETAIKDRLRSWILGL